jgi:hypothetical protein
VQGIGREGDLAQRATSGVVVSLEITLEHQPTPAHDDDAVEILNALLRDCLVEWYFEVGGEACFAWRNRKLVGPGRCGR